MTKKQYRKKVNRMMIKFQVGILKRWYLKYFKKEKRLRKKRRNKNETRG
mgnify:CR=1 FL=1